jgi:S23 ribosomal protein.
LEKRAVKTYRDLNVYSQSFELAMEVFKISSRFPIEEKYALTDQMKRAARSIPANLAEGWAKRKYENIFKRHLYDCIGSCEEMKVWLEFAKSCKFLDSENFERLYKKYSQVGAMLASLVDKWQTF